MVTPDAVNAWNGATSAAPGAVIAGIGVATPGAVTQEALWDGFFADHFSGVQRTLAKRIFGNAGVTRRHAAVNPLVEDVTGWSTAQRMQRYLLEALPLGKAAVGDALAASGVPARDVGLFVVCSCTGYVTPGLDILLARDMGMSERTQRLFVGHMGCYAAIPGLGAAQAYTVASGRPAVLLCCELTSLHLQPASAETDQIVAHSLFADAAAAVVVTPGGPGYAIRGVASITDASAADHMTWEVTDHGFRMGLSARVPDVLAEHVAGFVNSMLGEYGLDRSGVDGWAVHPGGPRILDVVARELALPDGATGTSRGVLDRYGNCSSPTVLMIIDAMRGRPRPPQRIMALAFGPGLTLCAALLDRC